jgi:fluoroquinolone resistance protein
MNHLLIEEKIFEKQDFTANPLPNGEYENCTFSHCDFSHSTFARSTFLGCTFVGCNLSLVNLTMTTLGNVSFRACKLLGLRFDTCNSFGFSVSFDDCNLNHSSFQATKLKKTTFKDVFLHEVDFTGCDLMGSIFDNCDLTRATFHTTVLEKVDFRTSFNYSINPENNRLKKAKFSLSGVAGLLDKYDITIDTLR